MSIKGAEREQLRELATRAGALRCGFAKAEEVEERFVEKYRAWIAEGCHGTMGYLEKYDDVRKDPRLLLEGARTVMACVFPYYSYGKGRPAPKVAEYALGTDYHEELRRVLGAVTEEMERRWGGMTRVCVDTAPLRERYWAVRCGLGHIGRNCQLIVPGAGSAFFIATILWTEEVEADEALSSEAGAVCGECRKCVVACPGHALKGDGSMDARRCLSYQTIESREALPEDTDTRGYIYGCDICRLVCPHQKAWAEVLPGFMPREELTAADAETWENMTGGQYKRLTAHSAMRRTPLKRVKEMLSLVKRGR